MARADKGGQHNYDNTRRQELAEQRALSRMLKNFQTSGILEDPGSRKLKRREERENLLPPPEKRVCPECNRTKPSSRQWVLLPGKTPICRSCWQKSVYR